MVTVGIVIDVADDAHYSVALQEETETGFVEVSYALIDRPLRALPERDSSDDLSSQFHTALRATPDAAAIEVLGQHLWRLTFDETIGPAWAERHPSRTLLDIRSDELQGLPWETLQQDLKAFFMAEELFVRAPVNVAPVQPVRPPLRVLVVLGQKDGMLEWRDELRALEVLGAKHPGFFHVEVLELPDKATLRATCQSLRPHILHVIAHGTSNGRVLIGGPGSPAAFVLDPSLAVALAHRFPLVVLNACHTGEPRAMDGPLGLSKTFRAHGSAATLCMQGAIRGTAAANFSSAFYSALIAGKPIDAACVAGRQAIADRDDGVDRWLPQLVMQAAPGPLLSVPRGFTAPDPLGAIDRSAERRQLLFALDPAETTAPRGAAIIHGAEQVGKTWVARSTGDLLRSVGAAVRYVDLNGTRKLGWLDVLRAIRDPAPNDGSYTTLPPPPTVLLPMGEFAKFNAGVNAVSMGKPPPDQVKGVPVDAGRPIGPAREATLDHIGLLFQMFLNALTASAGGSRLVLILDHIENVADDQLKIFLIPRLLAPLAKGEVADVSVIVVSRASAVEPLLSLPALVVPVLLPAADQFQRFAEVYRDIWFDGQAYGQETIEQYNAYMNASRVLDGWSLSKLKGLYKMSTGQAWT